MLSWGIVAQLDWLVKFHGMCTTLASNESNSYHPRMSFAISAGLCPPSLTMIIWNSPAKFFVLLGRPAPPFSRWHPPFHDNLPPSPPPPPPRLSVDHFAVAINIEACTFPLHSMSSVVRANTTHHYSLCPTWPHSIWCVQLDLSPAQLSALSTSPSQLQTPCKLAHEHWQFGCAVCYLFTGSAVTRLYKGTVFNIWYPQTTRPITHKHSKEIGSRWLPQSVPKQTTTTIILSTKRPMDRIRGRSANTSWSQAKTLIVSSRK